MAFFGPLFDSKTSILEPPGGHFGTLGLHFGGLGLPTLGISPLSWAKGGFLVDFGCPRGPLGG